jgi:N-acetyl-anhydromuramyl-L-alanine amidase AmpD
VDAVVRIQVRQSPNFNTRPPDTDITTLVIHADASPTTAGTLDWITSPASRVSYHYLVGRLGHVYQCVATDKRAWHCGVSEHNGRPDVNDFSLGICFSNKQDGEEEFTEEQYESGRELVAVLRARFPTIAHIVTHAEIARPVGRKRDPGPLFDMSRLT